MAGRLTTHVLDTARGRPAAGVRVEAFRLSGDAREPLASLTTNADGRCDSPVLEGTAFAPGTYELVFHVAARSEEHTSELQSLMRISYAVFCLKKKTMITPIQTDTS